MVNYAPRISLSFNDVSGVIKQWSTTCLAMAVYEHEADKDVNTTHIHLIMVDSKYKTEEQYKRILYKELPSEARKGNDLWSWHHKSHPNPDLSFIKYMSKGKLRPVFVSNVIPAVIDEWTSQWEDVQPIQSHIIPPDPKVKLTKYAIMLRVVDSILTRHPLAIDSELKNKVLQNTTDEIWIKHIRKVLIYEKQLLGLYKVMDIYDSCIMYYNKESFVNNCLSVIQKRIPRV